MYHPVGIRGEALVVRHDDERLAHPVAQLEEKGVQLLLVLGVEAARGLVGEDDGGVVD